MCSDTERVPTERHPDERTGGGPGQGPHDAGRAARAPRQLPLVTAGRAFDIGRTKAHELARSGEFPCRVLRIGSSYRVTRADLFRSLGIEDEPLAAAG